MADFMFLVFIVTVISSVSAGYVSLVVPPSAETRPFYRKTLIVIVINLLILNAIVNTVLKT